MRAYHELSRKGAPPAGTTAVLIGLAILLCVAVGLLHPAARAQSFGASLLGNVTDASGAAIPNVAIVAINSATNVRTETHSDGTGRYVITALQPGVYSLEASAPGFKKFVQSGIELAVAQQARVDILMAVGEITERITVEAAVANIDTSSSTIGKVVSNRAILNLPLNTRNVYSLIYLTPGVAGSIGNNYNSMSYSINGARTSMMETLIDGATASHPTVQGYAGISAFPSVDAIGEFKVLGANFSAEYGRTAGSVLNVVYKSGTNEFHGTAYEFLRNSKLDANTFYNNMRGVALASFKRSQYGGTFGGPIRKDRTFFMSSYEGLRQRSFSSRTTTVPTALERTGDFSQTFAGANNPVLIFDPFTTRPSGSGFVRDPFPGNVIPAGRQDRVARNIMKYYPQPNTRGAAYTNANNYYNQGSTALDIDQIDGRFDHNFSSNHRFFLRYSYRNQDNLPPVLWPAELKAAETNNNERNRMHNGVFDYTMTPNAVTVITVRGAVARSLYLYENLGLGFLASSLGFPAALDTAGGLPMFPRITASNYTTLGNQDNRRNAFMTYTLTGSVTRLKGPHTLKAGYEGRLIRVNNRESRAASGTFSFTAGFTQGPNPNQAAANRGNSIASLLLGTGSSGSLIQSFKDAATQSTYTALYLQDDWRLTRKLTLNLGVRYDLDTPRTERYNRMNYFDPAARSPLADKVRGYSHLTGGLVFVGIDGRPRTQYIMDTNNLAPRFGFAYQAAQRTVVRGGYGHVFAISLQQAHGTVGPFGFRTETPWVSTIDGITPNYLLSNPFPAGFNAPPGASQGLLTQAGANIQAPVRETLTPWAMQWNFNIQQSLPGDVVLEVAYVGTRGLQLSRNDESGLSLNQLDPRYMALGSQLNQTLENPFYGIVGGVLATPRVSRAQLLRPYPQFTDVIPLYSTGASSNYHSLQTSFSRRFSGGLQFEGSYTWAKAIQEALRHQNSYYIRASRSLADYDIAHRFVVSYIYELPFGRGRRLGTNWSKWVNGLLGGWQFNGITTYQTGTPLSISANNVAGIFNPVEWANNNGRSGKLSGSVHQRLQRYFDTSVFSQPPPFTFGNTQPTSPDLRSPGVRNWDLSIFKEFQPLEKATLQFRAEAFNAFNTVRFGSPNTSVTSNQFGQISTQANSPRQLQFGLKLLW